MPRESIRQILPSNRISPRRVGQQLQDARHAGLGPVGAHRHVQGSLRARGVAVEPGTLAVEIEGHHDGAFWRVAPAPSSSRAITCLFRPILGPYLLGREL